MFDSRRAASLAAALVIGVTISAGSFGQVYAEQKDPPKDNGIRCAKYHWEPDVDYTFFMPGDIVVNKENGQRQICTSSGDWKNINRSAGPSGVSAPSGSNASSK
jgi:hypothetical protein